MVERRDMPVGDHDGVSLRQYFERVLREESTRLHGMVEGLQNDLSTALEHHKEMHTREHTWADRLQEVFQQTVQSAVDSHEAKFDAFEREYRERHADLRERSDGRDTRMREDFTREMNDMREMVHREVGRMMTAFERDSKGTKQDIHENSRELTGIKSRYQAYAVALTIFLTIITIGINLVGVLLGGAGVGG